MQADSIVLRFFKLLACLRVFVFSKSKLWPRAFLCKVRALERSLLIRARLCSSMRHFRSLEVSTMYTSLHLLQGIAYMHPGVLFVLGAEMGDFRIFLIVLDETVAILMLGSLRFSAMVRDRELVGTVMKRVDDIFVFWTLVLWWIFCA